jgi:hypothetical protein
VRFSLGEVVVVIKNVRFDINEACVWLYDVRGMGVAMWGLCCLGASLGGVHAFIKSKSIIKKWDGVICVFSILFCCIWLFKCC